MSSSNTTDHFWAVVLAGGIGSRFWPVSTPARPKQLLPLASDRSIIVDTIERTLPLIPAERLRILTGEHLAAAILDELPAFGLSHLLLEPQARGTAPVLVYAAHTLARQHPDAVMASLHADHVIAPAAAFRDQLGRLMHYAGEHDVLLTIGVRPDRAETGYGYIHLGERLDAGADVHAVRAFVEKPDAATARAYVEGGEHLWNTGIFVWRAAFFLDEVRRHTPELAALLPLLDDGDVRGFFEQAPPLTVDVGVLERSSAVAVSPAAFHWDDVGTWDAVARSRPLDGAGNAFVGPVRGVDTRDCVAWSDDDEPIVLFGARDLVVVHADGMTFVAPRDRVAELKDLLEQLPDELREMDR